MTWRPFFPGQVSPVYEREASCRADGNKEAGDSQYAVTSHLLRHLLRLEVAVLDSASANFSERGL